MTMDESERLQRVRSSWGFRGQEERAEHETRDEEFADRIAALLNDSLVDKNCMVDAYYYDYSVIPDAVQNVWDFSGDVYLIFGITIHGRIVSKWVGRWDLDSNDPIVDGKVVRPERKLEGGSTITTVPPEVLLEYNPLLLSTPCPYVFREIFTGPHPLSGVSVCSLKERSREEKIQSKMQDIRALTKALERAADDLKELEDMEDD